MDKFTELVNAILENVTSLALGPNAQGPYGAENDARIPKIIGAKPLRKTTRITRRKLRRTM